MFLLGEAVVSSSRSSVHLYLCACHLPSFSYFEFGLQTPDCVTILCSLVIPICSASIPSRLLRV